MANHQSIKYGFVSSRDLLEKLERDRDALKKAFVSQKDYSIKDAIFNFCITAYSIKDWIRDENPSLNTVERHVTDTVELAICADIANSSKHRVQTGKIRVQAGGSMLDEEPRADMTGITADSTMPNGYTVVIHMNNGVHREIHHFANSVIDAWKKYLTDNQL